jgi:hypothetical protein
MPDAPDMTGAATPPPRIDAVTALYWLTKLLVAFFLTSAVLIAGFAPYTANMYEVLKVSGILLLGAGASALLGAWLNKRRPPEHGGAGRS